MSVDMLLMLLWLLAAQASPPRLPVDVETELRKRYADPSASEIRYFSAEADLNGDAKAEILVYVLGPMACGSGGCNLLVFTPEATRVRLVSSTSVTSLPVTVSAEPTHGWSNLIVRVSGGGARPHDVELLFDGKSYSRNASTAKPAPPNAKATLLIPDAPFDKSRALTTAAK